jgi:hypothetical protein
MTVLSPTPSAAYTALSPPGVILARQLNGSPPLRPDYLQRHRDSIAKFVPGLPITEVDSLNNLSGLVESMREGQPAINDQVLFSPPS